MACFLVLCSVCEFQWGEAFERLHIVVMGIPTRLLFAPPRSRSFSGPFSSRSVAEIALDDVLSNLAEALTIS